MNDVNVLEGISTGLEAGAPLCMPRVLVELLEALLEQHSFHVVVDIVMQDAALTARIIQAASKGGTTLNAAEPVSSAVQSLGEAKLTTLARQASQQVLRHGLNEEELRFQYQLWFRARVGGIAARCIAPSVNYPDVEEAQLSGLLMNLGVQALFVKNPSEYLLLATSPWSDSAQVEREKSAFGIDHLSLATALIGNWQLDSFLVDAIRFLHEDVTNIERSCVLLKIVRLAHRFCQDPQVFDTEFESLSERLFSFSPSEAAYLFDWSRGLFADFAALATDPEALQEDFSRSLERLTELTFILVDQESARARLAGGGDLQSLAAVARSLYLENSPACDALFLFLDHQQNQLNGIPVAGQSRMIAELKMPFTAGTSLVADALLTCRLSHSFDEQRAVSVSDRLLTRLVGGQGVACQPFVIDGQSLGAVVLGLTGHQHLEAVESLRLKMLSQVVAAALAQAHKGMSFALSDNSSLLWRVGNEISNPLTVIANYAEVLKPVLQGTPNAGLPDTIKREVRRIADVVDYYLDRQDTPDIPEQDVDLSQLVQDSLDTLTDSLINPKQIRIKQALEQDLGRVATNAVLMEQALTGLIRNAVESAPRGGVVEVSLRSSFVAQQGCFVEIIIRDNGPGIPPQVLRRMFQPIVRAKDSGHGGVGLNIVKNMVDDLGGQLSCHSSDVGGTSYHLLIPHDPVGASQRGG